MVKCMSVYKDYEKEVKNKYGQTDAYKEYEVKTKDYSKDKWNNLSDGMNDIMQKFAECKNQGLKYNSNEVLIQGFDVLQESNRTSTIKSNDHKRVELLLKSVDIWLIKCNTDISAAKTAYNGIFKGEII